MSEIIRARGLTKTYNGTRAVDGIDLDVQPGRIVGLIGPNGAGKTTTLKAILGLTECGGELSVLGYDPYRQRAALMQHVAFIADVATLPPWIRVDQLLDFVEGVHPRFDRQRAKAMLARTKIAPTAKVRALSKGMIVQLHLALVLAVDARLLVLDEPTLGLDIIFRREFYTTLLEDYFDEQRTILVSTHQVEEIEHILTDVIFIRDGRIALCEDMERLAERYVEVRVHPDRAAQAEALSPVNTRVVFGKKVYLFDGVDRDELKELGELHNPSVADIFIATVTRGAA